MTAFNSLPVPATAEEYLAQSNPDVLRAMVKMLFAEQPRCRSGHWYPRP